jgi:hypothetical protein
VGCISPPTSTTLYLEITETWWTKAAFSIGGARVEALLEAQKLLEAEYGWGKTSDQQVLQPIIAELEPAVQAYFTEELEDGATVYYVDGCEATVTQFSVAELDKAQR